MIVELEHPAGLLKMLGSPLHLTATPVTYRRRLWKIRFDDLPAAIRNKLATDGELTIKVGDYAGPYDVTWTAAKAYFRNLETNQDETAEL